MTTAASGHVVLAEADSAPFGSLRRRPPRARSGTRWARRCGRRCRAPRSGGWEVRADRPDPVELIRESHQGRLDWLIPTRVARMVGSPYGFLRGSAIVMASDVAALPATGITPVICGDAHLGNFGFYASPEGELVIDLNDFDEAHPGGWEWDLRRLVASIWVAGRENGSSEEQCADSVASCVRAYRDEVVFLADEPLLMRSYNRLDVHRLHETATEKTLRAEIARSAKRARERTSDRALPRFTREHHGKRQIVEEPPLITHVMRAEEDAIAEALDGYLETLAPHWRRVVGGYTILDVAHKVVGVGSVGLRAYVVLLEGSSPDDVLFLQLKQARRSVLAPYVHGESAWHAHQGQRVVEYQQALQTVSDPLLGLDHGGGVPVLRPAVPEHEGHHPAGRHRHGGADRLRRHRRAPAGQGARPDQRRLDDRRLLRQGRQHRAGDVPVRRGVRQPDRGRPRRLRGRGPGRQAADRGRRSGPGGLGLPALTALTE